MDSGGEESSRKKTKKNEFESESKSESKSTNRQPKAVNNNTKAKPDFMNTKFLDFRWKDTCLSIRYIQVGKEGSIYAKSRYLLNYICTYPHPTPRCPQLFGVTRSDNGCFFLYNLGTI